MASSRLTVRLVEGKRAIFLIVGLMPDSGITFLTGLLLADSYLGTAPAPHSWGSLHRGKSDLRVDTSIGKHGQRVKPRRVVWRKDGGCVSCGELDVANAKYCAH
jgi:hypothetical protein